MRKRLLTVLLTPCLATAAPPADSLPGLFAGTCMKHFYARHELRKAMREAEALEASADQAGFFLDSKPGTAWFVPAPSTTYVVALREDNICAVFAQRADSAQTQAGFAGLVGSAPEPLVAASEDAPSLGPADDQTRTSAYSWGRAGDKGKLLFVVTTSDDPDATAQAMATMSLVPNASQVHGRN